MDFALSDDQRAIQEAARDFLADAANPDVVRAAVESETGFDETLWASLAGELGFAGILVPEAFGGLGMGAVEMALVLEETGRTLAPVPFFETAVLAVLAVREAGSKAQQAAPLPRLAPGARARLLMPVGAHARPADASGRPRPPSRFSFSEGLS